MWTGESTPLRFPGQRHDPETGLAYNLHRYYDPETGQYASVDPLGLAPSPHPRNYVPNPTAAIDPLGLQACPAQLHEGPLTRRGAAWADSRWRRYKETDWRELGRALKKHTGPNRSEADYEVFGPWAPRVGNPDEFNLAGQDLTREILTNPETVVGTSFGRHAGVFQDLVVVGIPGGAAFRATEAGEFVGFIVWR